MATKSKKYNPLIIWLAFFIGVNFIFATVIGSIYLYQHRIDIFTKDYRETSNYKEAIFYNLDRLIGSLNKNDLLSIDPNLSYYAVKIDSGSEVIDESLPTEITKPSIIYPYEIHLASNENFSKFLSYFEENKNYIYLLVWDGDHFTIKNNSNPINPSKDKYYKIIIDRYSKDASKKLSNLHAILALSKDFKLDTGSIYSSFNYWITIKTVFIVTILTFTLGISLLILSIKKRVYLLQYTKKIASFLGKLWLEPKLLIILIPLFVTFRIMNSYEEFISLVILVWCCYFLLIDLFINRKKFLTNNFINYAFELYYQFESKKPFQKSMLIRFLLLVTIELILIFLTLVLLSIEAYFIVILFILLGIYLFYRYTKDYMGIVNEMGTLVDQIDIIKNGDMSTKLEIKAPSPLTKTAENLNNIQEGVQIAIKEQLKSEQLKIELITNVSHDLKTPLTAIVNYVDLLEQENLMPEYANDYVKVLGKKVLRLSTLTQDIFDISKAQSGNLELNIEKIDIVELVKQSLAELNDKITNSELLFKINLPQEKIFINADGKKLYRIFDNLLTNILKYSIPNSRVYIDVFTDSSKVFLTFKNISSSELNLSGNELIERFIRGDQARSTEGSGLGLAIVQSFVTLNGGTFKIDIDGDLFKATISFDIF